MAKRVLGPAVSRRLGLAVGDVRVIGNRALRAMRSASSRAAGLEPPAGRAARAHRIFAASDRQVFLGYYDLTPFCGEDRRLLALQAPLSNRPPRPDTEVAVGYYDLHDERAGFVELGRTTTWCWQQGCRLQWCPAGGTSRVLYNRMVEGRYGCVIQDVGTRKLVKSLTRPVYAASPDGRWGLSLDFSRLARLRPGYGYCGLPDSSRGDPAPDSDGIWRIDLETGGEELLVSLAELAAMDPLEGMAGAEHYFNHVLVNPDGTRFLFFHLWTHDGGRHGRLVTCDPDGGDRCILAGEGHVSHYNWRSADEVVAYATHGGRSRYRLYRDRSSAREVIGEGVLVRDGHPTFSPDGRRLLTDSYPDEYGEQHLLLYHLEDQDLERLGAFFRPLRYRGELRCDLHPRWSRSGRFVCFDSAHREGKRALHVLELMGQGSTSEGEPERR